MLTLPFIKRGELKQKDGTVIVAELPISDPWPTNRTVFDAGMHYDHEAEADLYYNGDLVVPNLILEIEGDRFMVIEVARHDYVPHCVLRLRRTAP